MELGKLLIYADRSVLFCLLTPVRIRASAAILAFVDFLLSPVLIPLDRLSVCKVEFFVIRANQVAIFVCLEIDCAERIISVFFVGGFLLVHGEFHVLLHPMLLAVEIIVEGTVPGVRNRVFGIETELTVKFLHERNKAVHIRTVLHGFHDNDVLVCHANLDIVSWKKLVVPHIILLHPHESGIRICL